MRENDLILFPDDKTSDISIVRRETIKKRKRKMTKYQNTDSLYVGMLGYVFIPVFSTEISLLVEVVEMKPDRIEVMYHIDRTCFWIPKTKFFVATQ